MKITRREFFNLIQEGVKSAGETVNALEPGQPELIEEEVADKFFAGDTVVYRSKMGTVRGFISIFKPGSDIELAPRLYKEEERVRLDISRCESTRLILLERYSE